MCEANTSYQRLCHKQTSAQRVWSHYLFPHIIIQVVPTILTIHIINRELYSNKMPRLKRKNGESQGRTTKEKIL